MPMVMMMIMIRCGLTPIEVANHAHKIVQGLKVVSTADHTHLWELRATSFGHCLMASSLSVTSNARYRTLESATSTAAR